MDLDLRSAHSDLREVDSAAVLMSWSAKWMGLARSWVSVSSAIETDDECWSCGK